MSGRLIALDLPGGPDFVDALRRVWDRGDAAFPMDQRLPAPARAALFTAMRPGGVIDASGEEHRRNDGLRVDEGDALVVATSGTTGQPRGVVLRHEAVAASSAASNERLGVDEHDHWLACLPLSHVGGLSVVCRALHAGTRLTVHPGFDPDAVGTVGATLVSLVPTALGRLDSRSFRRILLGGSRPPVHRPANVVVTYGMTETGSGIVYDRVPLAGVEIDIRDPSGRPLGPGELGEIHVRAPMLFRSYRDGAVPFESGWFATGDLGSIDAEGRLDVHGRAGDLIITGGENVWPESVERALADHPAVRDVAVAGVADPEWGQLVTAYVVAEDPAPTLRELRDWARTTIPAFAAPRRVEFVSSIPRSTLGKVIRHALDAPADPERRGTDDAED